MFDKNIVKNIASEFFESLNERDFAPLFNKTKENAVNVIQINDYHVLERSQQIDAIISGAVGIVRNAHEQKDSTVKGVLYILFRLEKEGDLQSGKIPLYVGKASRFGKNNQRLSSLFSSKNRKPRWDYYKNGQYHLSNLSSIVCHGYSPKEQFHSYQNWAKLLFKEYPSHRPILNFTPYLWFKTWTDNDTSIIAEIGNTSLHLEEALLIDLLSKVFPGEILNKASIDND